MQIMSTCEVPGVTATKGKKKNPTPTGNQQGKRPLYVHIKTDSKEHNKQIIFKGQYFDLADFADRCVYERGQGELDFCDLLKLGNSAQPKRNRKVGVSK